MEMSGKVRDGYMSQQDDSKHGKTAPMQWHPCKISPEALLRLRLAAAVTGREMREIASEAILAHAASILANNQGDLMRMTEGRKKKRKKHP